MRATKIYVLALGVLVLASCRKNDFAEKVSSEPSSLVDLKLNDRDTISVSVNGTAWTGSSIRAIIATQSNQLVINAPSSDEKSKIELVVPANIEPGTYQLESFGEYMATLSEGNDAMLVSSSGTITINERNPETNRITGSFSFKAKEIEGDRAGNISGGQFSVAY